MRSANFRPIFAAICNQYAKTPKTLRDLWPLSIDGEYEEDEPIEKIYERNRQLIETVFNN